MKIPILCIIFYFCYLKTISCDDVLVQVKQGWLRGELLDTVTGESQYYSFKGIPYAKPPVGSLRFKAPQEPESWDGVRNATAHGSVCPQVDVIRNLYIPGSENCLFLNVYTPSLFPDTLLPVMFFIHGGAYKFGSGDVDFYGPDFLVAKDVIVVTINYRLDALGFLTLGIQEVAGNAGLKDQVLALKWVQNNIKTLGGNPNNVTIFGESAGAASVAYHTVSPMSKNLFQKAILQSGVPNLDALIPYKPEARAFVLGKELGLETKNASELLKFLQNVDVDKLINTTSTVLASEEITNVFFKLAPFTPVIEKDYGQDRFVIEDPFISLESGNVNNVDVMFSYNSQEALVMIPFYEKNYIQRYNRYPEMFVPSKVLIHSAPDVILDIADKIIKYYFGNKTVSIDNMPEFVNYGNFANIVYDVHRFFRKWPQVGRTYFFKCSCYSSRNYLGLQGAPYGIIGTSHGDDLFYIFDPKSLGMSLTKNTREYKLVEQMSTVFTNFAKYGNPTPDLALGITWPQFDNISLAYVDIGDNLTIGHAPDEKHIQFWKGILELAGITF